MGRKSGSDPDKTANTYLALSVSALFGQVPPKPNQKHHLDLIGLLIDGFGSGFLKSGSGSAKKPGSIQIRIRNTAFGRLRLKLLKSSDFLLKKVLSLALKALFKDFVETESMQQIRETYLCKIRELYYYFTAILFSSAIRNRPISTRINVSIQT